MRVTYGVSLTNKKQKTQDVTDRLNFGLTIKDTRYYQHRDRSGQLITAPFQRLARPMTQECATQLVAKLQNEFDEVSAVELLTDDEQTVATNFIELGEEQPPVSAQQYNGIRDLKAAIELCFREGLGSLEILAAANKAVIQG
jgi:hypothetical protein